MRNGMAGDTDPLEADLQEPGHGLLAQGASHGATWRVPRPVRGIDPGTRKLAWTAAALGGALVLVIGLYSAAGHRSTVVPVIQADSRPIRTKPENRGGMQISGTEEDVMGGDAVSPATRLAPGSEAPAPKMLRAQQDAPPAPTQAVTPAKEAVIAPPVVAAVPPETEKPRVAVLPVGKTAVQFGALGTEQAAHAEWKHLTGTFPDLFASRQPAVSRTEHDGHVLWRLRTGGFADAAQATAFCERVRAQRAGCSIASF